MTPTRHSRRWMARIDVVKGRLLMGRARRVSLSHTLSRSVSRDSGGFSGVEPGVSLLGHAQRTRSDVSAQRAGSGIGSLLKRATSTRSDGDGNDTRGGPRFGGSIRSLWLLRRGKGLGRTWPLRRTSGRRNRHGWT